MPGRDRTGPFGDGPFTGRGAGFCAGYVEAGLGQGGRRGRGYRARFCSADRSRPSTLTEPVTLPRSEEVRLLRTEAERMQSALEAIQRRLEQLETT